MPETEQESRLRRIREASFTALESAQAIIDGDHFSVEGFDQDTENDDNFIIYIGYDVDPQTKGSSLSSKLMGSGERKFIKVYFDDSLQVIKMLPLDLD